MNAQPEFNLVDMLRNEIHFCDAFAEKVVKPFGILYFIEQNPLSHDSNHANILDLSHPLDLFVQEVKGFYQRRNLSPRIYCSYLDSELELLRPFLTAHGFQIEIYSSIYMLLRDLPVPLEGNSQGVRRISEISADIVELIRSEDDGDWTINVLKRHLRDSRFHLLGYFHQGRCVAMASVKILDGYSRVDDVLTHSAFRGRHFGTRLINYLIHYHAHKYDNNLYLYTENPIAIKMYENEGFQKVDINKVCWSAHCP